MAGWGEDLDFFSGIGFPDITGDMSGCPLKTGAPILSIYYSGDTPDITINGTSIELVHDGSTLTISTVGKSTSQIAAEINRHNHPYTANVMFEVDNVSTLAPFTSATDVTVDSGQIIRAEVHVVKPLEETQIRISAPYNDGRFDPWYIIVNRGWVVRQTGGSTWIFAVPDYEKQTWSLKYGRGFVDQEDVVAERLGPRALGVPRAPIHWDRNNLQLRVRDTIQPSTVIKDVDIHNGVIYLNRDYDDNEVIFVNYTYKEDGYVYDKVNLNPTEFHNPGVLGRYVVFYLIPYIGPDGVITDQCLRYSESSTLAGAIYKIPKTIHPIMLLGAAQVRQAHDVDEVSIIDTRQRGGGVVWDKFDEAKRRNREVMSTADRGFFDGHPYPGNMAMFITVPSEIKDNLEKAEIEGTIKRFVAYGSYIFVEYD